jgi:hypothetical protein
MYFGSIRTASSKIVPKLMSAAVKWSEAMYFVVDNLRDKNGTTSRLNSPFKELNRPAEKLVQLRIPTKNRIYSAPYVFFDL